MLTLLGIAYIYGAFGVIDFSAIKDMSTNSHKYTLMLGTFGIILVFIGSFFKLAIANFDFAAGR